MSRATDLKVAGGDFYGAAPHPVRAGRASHSSPGTGRSKPPDPKLLRPRLLPQCCNHSGRASPFIPRHQRRRLR
jgi:hypothetical protein